MRIDLENGKYTYVFEPKTGIQYALRHGQHWRDLVGDKFVYCLATELEEAREQQDAIAAQNEMLTRIIMSSNKADEPHTMSALNEAPETRLAVRDAHQQADTLIEAANTLPEGEAKTRLLDMAKQRRDSAWQLMRT